MDEITAKEQNKIKKKEKNGVWSQIPLGKY